MSQLLDKPVQPRLLPDRRPIIQIAERSPLQQSQNINPSKTRLKVPIPKSSIITKSSGHHDKVIPVLDYPIPQTMSEHGSVSRTIRRKGMQDTRRKFQLMLIPFVGPCLNQLKYLYR